MKHLLHAQLRHLWLVFQGTAELVRHIFRESHKSVCLSMFSFTFQAANIFVNDVFRRSAEMCRQGAGKWLTEVVDLFEADIRTYESIMVNWRSKEDIEEPRGHFCR